MSLNRINEGSQPPSRGWAKALLLVGLILAAYTAWPYVALYRLDAAVAQRDETALEQLIDLDSVRAEIKKKLNKEMSSQVGEVSNGFVEWIQDGLMRLGGEAIDHMVSMQWVEEQLLSKSNPADRQAGFREQVSYAFFDDWNGFLVRLGGVDQEPVFVRMSLQGLDWRVTAIYN